MINLLFPFINQEKNLPYHDYVINRTSDTINVTIKVNFFSDLLYKNPNDSKFRPITFPAVKEYYLKKSNEKFRGFRIPFEKEPQYLKVIYEGRITIYDYRKKYSRILYITKSNNEILKVMDNGVFPNNKNIKDNIFALINDDKMSLDSLNKIKRLTFYSVIKIFKFYDNMFSN